MLQQSLFHPAGRTDQSRATPVNLKIRPVSLVFFALVALTPFAYVYITNRSRPPAAWDELTPFLGTWTDETGKEGNFITFRLVWRKAPGPFPGLQVGEGQVVCHRFLDGNEGEASWNYESCKAHRLNVTFPGRSRIAAYRMVDQDHMMIRFVEDLPFDKHHAAFPSPDARLLTRVRAGAEGPSAGGKEAP
jgi:hypothetical protein